MAAQKPKREKGLFLRAQEWLQRRHPRFSRKSEVILLPQRVRCFGKRLLLSLPADFYAEQQKKGQILFAGSKSGLQMNVMRLPFRRPLHSISAMDLQLAFGQLPLPDRLPVLKRGFLRYSPVLTAFWDAAGPEKEKTVLHLAQVRDTVFLLFFRHITAENESVVNAIIYAMSMNDLSGTGAQ